LEQGLVLFTSYWRGALASSAWHDRDNSPRHKSAWLVLARITGQLRDRIACPLGGYRHRTRPQTVRSADDGQQPRRAEALRRHECRRGSDGLYSTGNDITLWLPHNFAANDPAVGPTLALAHAVYRQRQAMTAAIGFDEAGTMGGLALGWVVNGGAWPHASVPAKIGWRRRLHKLHRLRPRP
jgi:hypothetical protein